MSKLMVLDDDQIQHFILKKMLNKYKIFGDTLFSNDGRIVLEFLESHKSDFTGLPELLFVDLNMPLLSGWNFLDKLSKLYPKLFKKVDVHIISSSVDPRDINRSYNYSFVKSYIIKPLTSIALDSIVKNVH